MLHVTILGRVRNGAKVMPPIFLSVTCSYSFNEFIYVMGTSLTKL